MKEQNSKIGLSILLALILALIAIVPASADKPVHERFNWDYEYVWPADVDNPCGVDMNVHEHGKMEGFLWFDRNGEPYGDTSNVTMDMEISVSPDREVTLHFNFTWRWTYLPDGQGFSEFSGAMGKATIPGLGVVSGTLGRWVWLETCRWVGDEEVCDEEFYHDPGMVFDDPDTLCNYLIYGE